MLMKILIAFFSGALLVAAFAPFNLWPLAIVSPLLLLWLWQNTTPKQTALLGLFYGLGLYLVGGSWIYVSIHEFGNTHPLIAGSLTFVFLSVFALYFAVFGFVFAKVFKNRFIKNLICFPLGWLLLEACMTVLFTGFPWLLVGFSQIESPLSGYAPVFSVYGVSYLCVLASAFILMTVQTKKIFYLFPVVLILGGGLGLKHMHWTQPAASTIQVAIVQGNVKPKDKFTQNNPIVATWDLYGKMSLPHLKQADLIVWPENALPYPLPYAKPFVDYLDKIMKDNQCSLILGMPVMRPGKNRRYHNSLMALGQGKGHYYKTHLVPFGEYLPFEKQLRGLVGFFDLPMSFIVPGKSVHTEDFNIPNIKLAPLICYEMAFAPLVRQAVQNKQAIITVSEDGWFGASIGPHQHLAITRMRALETGLPIIRATSSGISAFINPDGTIGKISPQFEPAILMDSFSGSNGQTPWVQFGFWPFLWMLLGVNLFCLPALYLPARKALREANKRASGDKGSVKM